ncbi:MAG: type II toxin-antitoxin system RelB/DinJ family antitoxin [Oscillospiraceae bacterium]|nr:type II toxin-antitoxin system RelB/DinJ family antitoxin [Oscillospiraceae bacterium]
MKTNVMSIRTEPQLKSDIEKLYGSFGITVSDAVNMFFHKSLMVGGLPFDLKIDKPYVITKQDLDDRINNLKSGKGKIHEIVEVEE